eukprot:jgi/Botrbrau1/3461/Bobra.139_1s0036.2
MNVEGEKRLQDFMSSTMQRVKVYRLNAEGTWDDRGTGNVSVEYLEQADSMGLVVISEEDVHVTLLIHRICHEDIYQRQGEGTIISWSDADVGTEIALSFAEGDGCNEIWEKIVMVQQRFDKRHQEIVGRRRIISDEFEQAGLQDGGFPDTTSNGPIELPPADMEHLPELAKVLSDLGPFQRDRAAQQMMAPGFVRRLLDLFRTCEDLESAESMTHLYAIIKNAVMLADHRLLEHLLSDENVMDVVGALEYEPDVPEHMRVRHREFLRDKAVFKEVVPIEDSGMRARIHQTYRMGYLRDVILPRVLDEGTFSTLTNLMIINNVDVLNFLVGHGQFLPQLFQRLRSSEPGDEGWRDAVAFLQEMCGLARHQPATVRGPLYPKLVTLGLFEVLTEVMQGCDTTLRLRAIDVLHSVVQHDALPLREFMLGQKPRPLLLSLLLQPYVKGGDSAIMEQMLDMLRNLLDPDASREPIESDKFLDLFYADYMPLLLERVEHCMEKDENGKLPDATALGHIVELLIYCVGNHAFRIKYYVLKVNMVEKVLHLLRRREKWLVVAAVRFLRACVTPKDEFYHKYLVRFGLSACILSDDAAVQLLVGVSNTSTSTSLSFRLLAIHLSDYMYVFFLRQSCLELRSIAHSTDILRANWRCSCNARIMRAVLSVQARNNLFDDIVTLFLKNGDRYNLLNSALLDLFEYIRRENLKVLVEHVVCHSCF